MLKSKGDIVFGVINYILLLAIMVITIYPLYFIIIASVSNAHSVALGEVWFWPKGFNLNAYIDVFKEKSIWTGYFNTIVYTALGTLINLAVTIPCAYALAKKRLIGRNVIMGIFIFTMYFSGGMVPGYLLVKNLGMLDTIWAMIIPGAVSVYNMIITRTFFASSIPEELYEAAKIDGCSEFRAFFTIALPLSAAIIAVMALYYGVGHWNEYFNALIYMSNQDKFPLQLVLRNILIMNQNINMTQSMTAEQAEYMAQQAQLAEAMKYAVIFIASFPVLAAYPFVQKYFVKGVMIGAVKG